MTPDHRSPTMTEITIVGANCPQCLNETLDYLRAEPGVVEAQSTMSGQCLRIEHEQLPVHKLLELIRLHLHGVDFSAAEQVMVAIDPRVADLHCSHGQGDAKSG